MTVADFVERKPFGGPGFVFGIDGFLLFGKFKANRGRFRAGDCWAAQPNGILPSQDPNHHSKQELQKKLSRSADTLSSSGETPRLLWQ